MYLLQRQESNLLPLPYESTMQPPTPRCDIKTTYLHRPVAENKYPYIRNKSRRQERSRTSIYNIVLTITPPTENPATFTSGRVEIRICNKKHIKCNHK